MGESAGRVGAKQRIETKRLVEGTLVGRKHLVSIRSSASAPKLLNRRLPCNRWRNYARLY
jgi:hypothetical protein